MRVFLFVFCLCLSPPASAEEAWDGWRPFVGASFASQHFGADREFNETNPGLILGFIRPSTRFARFGVEYGVEAGIYENSFADRTVYGAIWFDAPVAGRPQAPFGELRLGLAAGYAEYDELVDEADSLGVLTIGDFVPFIAAQAAWRLTERAELRTRFGPGGAGTDFVMGFQVFYRL